MDAGIQIFCFFSRFAETVADSTTRDNQDTMSGEPPGDLTTKDPFPGRTEQPFDYEDATHPHPLDGEAGNFPRPFVHQMSRQRCVFQWCEVASPCALQGGSGRGPSPPSL